MTTTKAITPEHAYEILAMVTLTPNEADQIADLIRRQAADLAAAKPNPPSMRIRTHTGQEFDIVSWSNVLGSAESTVVVRRLNGKVFKG